MDTLSFNHVCKGILLLQIYKCCKKAEKNFDGEFKKISTGNTSGIELDVILQA